MAELVYAFDLKSNGNFHMGSSPISGTTNTVFVACHKKSPLTGVFFIVSNNPSSILYILECHVS